MNPFLNIAVSFGFGVLVSVVAIRPRAGGIVALLLFVLIGCREAECGHTQGVWIAAIYGFALGVIPILAHYAFARPVSHRNKS